MLGLSLRLEFRGKILQGTQIDLTNPKKTGATQLPAPDFLEITYPTTDLIGMLRAAAPGQSHPIALMGERGLGKSHLLGALYHALKDGTAASA
jgi:predicted AAA+ superfamily ATPase